MLLQEANSVLVPLGGLGSGPRVVGSRAGRESWAKAEELRSRGRSCLPFVHCPLLIWFVETCGVKN